MAVLSEWIDDFSILVEYNGERIFKSTIVFFSTEMYALSILFICSTFSI